MAQAEREDHADPELQRFMRSVLADPRGHLDFVIDVSERYRRWGTLSAKQGDAMRRCMEGKRKYEAARAARDADPTREPVPEGRERIRVSGKVLSLDTRENDYGVRLVLMLAEDRGFRLWGTCPSDLATSLAMVDLPGDDVRVEFIARVERSADDDYFGWFSRPTRASVLGEDDRNVCPACGSLRRDRGEIYLEGGVQVCIGCSPTPF